MSAVTPVPYNEHLAARIRMTLGQDPDISEKRMFGGVAFLRHGHMFVGVVRRMLMARVGKLQYAEALTRPHVRVMDFTGKPLTGYVYVDEPGLANNEDLHFWVYRCLDFAATLAPKAQPIKSDSQTVAALPNLGPRSAQALLAAGVSSLSDIQRLGAVGTYAKVKAMNPRATLNLLWALEGALTGLPWQVVAREHRTSLLLALDTLQRNR